MGNIHQKNKVMMSVSNNLNARDLYSVYRILVKFNYVCYGHFTVIQPSVQIQTITEDVTQATTRTVTPEPVAMDVVDARTNIKKVPIVEKILTIESKFEDTVNKVDKNTDSSKSEIETGENTTKAKSSDDNVNKTDKTLRTVEDTKKTESVEPVQTVDKPVSRKRAKSTSSNQSVDEPKTPVTRKRTQSGASNKTATEEPEQVTPEGQDVTPENKQTPSRRRAKTPTSAEVRKIITRRVSKEMAERSEEPIFFEETLTPKRRATRSRSKNVDDNESVASESSVTSNKSRRSESAGDAKPAPARRTRKSVVATKPELSAIPEVIVED